MYEYSFDSIRVTIYENASEFTAFNSTPMLMVGILNVKMASHLISNLILMLSAFHSNVHKSKGVSNRGK